MCLAKPMKLIQIDSSRSTGTVDLGGGTLEVGLDLVPEAMAGDYVLVHAGMAIEHLDIADAEAILDSYEKFVETGTPPPGYGDTA